MGELMAQHLKTLAEYPVRVTPLAHPAGNATLLWEAQRMPSR